MTTTTTDRFEALTIERNEVGDLMLTCPDMTGNGDDVIILHPAQARRIGELAGMVADREAMRELARLRRRLLTIDTHAERLARWLRECSDHKHADLTAETLMANTLADLAADAVADFSDCLPESAQDALDPDSGPATCAVAKPRATASVAVSTQGTLL
jgi:hypothetical protein